MKTLTDRQKEVLIFIAQFTDDNTYPPTVREIAQHFSISLRAAQDHIKALKKKEYILLTQKRSRSIKVIKDIRQDKDIPRITKVPLLKANLAEGTTAFSEENYDGFVYYTLPYLDPVKEYVALTVQDESLKDIGIFSGDTALISIEKAEQYEQEGENQQGENKTSIFNGKLVATVIDTTIVIRRYVQEEARVCLQPANADFRPVYSQEVRPLGLVSGIVRAY